LASIFRRCISRGELLVAEFHSTCTGELLPDCQMPLAAPYKRRDSPADVQAGNPLAFRETGAFNTFKRLLAESSPLRALLPAMSVLFRTFKNLYRRRFEVFY